MIANSRRGLRIIRHTTLPVSAAHGAGIPIERNDPWA